MQEFPPAYDIIPTLSVAIFYKIFSRTVITISQFWHTSKNNNIYIFIDSPIHWDRLLNLELLKMLTI